MMVAQDVFRAKAFAAGTELLTTNLVWSDRWTAAVNPSQGSASIGRLNVCHQRDFFYVFLNHILLMLDILGLAHI